MTLSSRSGVVAVTNAMLPLLRRSEAGRIANVSSGLGTFAYLTDPDEFGTLLAYNSSKAALNAITVMYARALGDTPITPITVNAVSPGFCATDLNGHLGVLTADEGGEHIARQATMPDRPAGSSSASAAARTPGDQSSSRALRSHDSTPATWTVAQERATSAWRAAMAS
jgi:NAD(P)-dependent dehydrogenase (short-subunit alcohol dehydrogenase family)